MANRRVLLKAIETVQNGGVAPGIADPALAAMITGPDTVDGIAPAGEWAQWWQQNARAKRESAPWLDAESRSPAQADTATQSWRPAPWPSR